MSYWLHRAARAELQDSADYYFQHASARVADTFLSEFARAIELLEENQGLGAKTASGLRIFPFCRFPYSIVYRESENGPMIYAIANQRRKPNYWLMRAKN